MISFEAELVRSYEEDNNEESYIDVVVKGNGYYKPAKTSGRYADDCYDEEFSAEIISVEDKHGQNWLSFLSKEELDKFYSILSGKIMRGEYDSSY